MSNQVTRARLIRAFSTPGRSRAEVVEAVRRYMGDSPVPPTWSLAGVRGALGGSIARQWARHIRHLGAAGYRDKKTHRWLYPVVQSIHDFDPSIVAAFKETC